MTRVTLRDVHPDDRDRVYAWNCAPEIRAVSADPRPVTPSDHARWFAARQPLGSFWIIEDDGVPVGTLRIDQHVGATSISIALGPEARARGVGRRAIRIACEAHGRPVEATIRHDNQPSLACFAACGFVPISATDDLVTYRWSP